MSDPFHTRADRLESELDELLSPEELARIRASEAVRGRARSLRLRVEAGDLLSIDEAVSFCVTRDDALRAFERTEDDAEGVRVFCCGEPASITDGIFGTKVECPRCHAKAVDATSPMFSPLLERGVSYLTIPSEKFLALFGERNWLVMHEGNR